MTSPPASSTARQTTTVERGTAARRLLAVVPARVARRIEGAIGGRVEAPASVFDAVAVAMLAPKSANAPTTGVTLVLMSDQLRSAPEATVASLRSAVTDLRLVAIVPATSDVAQAAPHPLMGVVDAVLFEPVTDSELCAALGAVERAPLQAENGSARQAASVDLQQVVGDAADPLDRAVAVAQELTEPLGDTDLIQEIMFGPEAIAATALSLIQQQTEWSDIRLIAPGDAIDGEGAAVKYAGDDYGTLAANGADADSLTQWAQWLARWLALDRSYREFRQLTYRDDLTGAWNRRFFDTFLAQTIRKAAEKRRPITVMVFDIDHFKRYNDEFGHEAGDEILKETVRLLNSVIRKGDRVCRIGGDEFAVVFADIEGPREQGSQHPESVEEIASRFQDQIALLKFPKLGQEAPGTLSISAGLATYPWDGTNSVDLLRKADELALQSKRKGKNVITFGPGAAEICKRHE